MAHLKLIEDMKAQAAADLLSLTTTLERRQLFAAVALTMGEFGACIWLMVHESDFISLFLAVTYYVRETRGGEKYHAGIWALASKCVRVMVRK